MKSLAARGVFVRFGTVDALDDVSILLEAGKATYPGIHGPERARHRAKELAEQAIELVTPLGPKAEPLALLARRVVSRSS